VEKLLEDGHLKLPSVISDIHGVSGRDMLSAIAAGQRDPKALAQLARGTMRGKIRRLEEALDCSFFTEEHATVLAVIDHYTTQIEALTARIEILAEPYLRQVEQIDAVHGIGRIGDKGEVLFGLGEARDTLAHGARPVIVEGPLDAIAAGQGRYAAIAACGTALTARHAAALGQAADLHKTGVTVAFDPDEAGRRAAVRAYHLLVPLTHKLAAVTFPAGQDPAQILADTGPAALAEALARCARPLPDLIINAELRRWTSRLLHYPEGQIAALRAAAPLIAAMPPAHVARQVSRLAAVLRLDHATVTEAVTGALTTLVSDQAASPRHDATVHHAAATSTAGVWAADHDSPHSPWQTSDRRATRPAPAPAKRATASQPRLTSGPHAASWRPMESARQPP
jgi:hypothetical protein